MKFVYCVVRADHDLVHLFLNPDAAKRSRDLLKNIYPDARVVKCEMLKDRAGKEKALAVVGVLE